MTLIFLPVRLALDGDGSEIGKPVWILGDELVAILQLLIVVHPITLRALPSVKVLQLDIGQLDIGFHPISPHSAVSDPVDTCDKLILVATSV